MFYGGGRLCKYPNITVDRDIYFYQKGVVDEENRNNTEDVNLATLMAVLLALVSAFVLIYNVGILICILII